MAKVYYNDAQHLIIQMNSHDASECNFGIEITGLNNMCVCGACNKECEPEDIYYACGVNEVFCKDCIEDFVKNMNHYTDKISLSYEVKHFNHIAKILNMKERAALTPNGKTVIYDYSEVSDHFTSYS